MKKVIAAFFWNGTKKTINFMIIDNEYHELFPPNQYHLSTANFIEFKYSAEKIIKKFFREIFNIYKTQGSVKEIKIEYKIVHIVSHELADQYQPSLFSNFIRKKFLEQYALTKAVILPLRLSQQLRSRLKRPELDKFKHYLRQTHMVKATRKNNFQFHLWILATHATKANYLKILKRLHKYRQAA